MTLRVAVLGDGAWGTAIALLLAGKGYHVTMWCYNAHVAHTIKTTRYNSHYLPGFIFDSNISVTTSMEEALKDVTHVFQAIPVAFLRTVLHQARPYYHPDQVWVVLSKGIEHNTLLLPSQIINEVFKVPVSTVIVSGPSFAHDVAHKKATAVVVAASTQPLADACAAMIKTSYVRPTVSLDIIGVQLCGALKNVIAVGVGLLDGAGYTDNTKAFLLTRGLHEIERVVQAAGGDSKTVYGFAGIGDLVLTAMGSLSRNVAVGKQLGAGQSLEDMVRSRNGVMPEGINTVVSLYQLAEKYHLDLPVCNALHAVITQGAPISTLVDSLIGL